MTNEELEMLTKMNSEGISACNYRMDMNNKVANENFQASLHAIQRLNGNVNNLADRLTGVETIIAVYAGVKIANFLWDRLNMNERIDKLFKKHDSEEKETYDETSASDI